MSLLKKEKTQNKESTISISGSAKNKAAFLIKKPWITERSFNLTASKKYVFIVEKNATKPEVKKAIEGIYGVKISSVNIVNKKGKTKRLGRSTGKVPGHKKAIITLKEGKIDIMPA